MSFDKDWKTEHKIDYLGSQLDALMALVTAQGVTSMQEFDDLKTAVAKLGTDLSADVDAGQAAATALHTQLDAANATVVSLQAGDVDKDAAIATLTQQLADAKSAATDVTASINAIDETANAAAANLNPAPPSA